MTRTRSAISTHVLDTALGRPAAGIGVLLQRYGGTTLDQARTDGDGRVAGLGPEQLEVGTYRLVFDTGGYYGSAGQPGFFPEVVLTFAVADPAAHYHLPLLLSPFGYSTYRGT
ncbi:MAG: hydroxyisourate hydrolase [Nocardioidaceae bacterium]